MSVRNFDYACGTQRVAGKLVSILFGHARSASRGAARKVTARFYVLLQSLVVPRGAYAEGHQDCSDPVEFMVTEQGGVVDALQGVLQRKNEEYYVRVRIRNVKERVRFQDRKVQVTLADAGKAEPIVQRDIDVGVAVLLGTALPLTEKCYIVAHLLPSVDIRMSEENRVWADASRRQAP